MNKLFTLVFLLLTSLSFSQEYGVTKEGLRDSKNLENDYLVIEAKSKTAKELYDKAIKYINQKYDSPEDVIKAQVENDYLRFDTFVQDFTKVKNGGVKISVDASYTIELKFKDGRIKFSLLNLDLGGVTWQGSIWKGYPIWNKKGKLRLPETKDFIENYFNSEVKTLSDFFNNKTKKDDW